MSSPIMPPLYRHLGQLLSPRRERIFCLQHIKACQGVLPFDEACTGGSTKMSDTADYRWYGGAISPYSCIAWLWSSRSY